MKYAAPVVVKPTVDVVITARTRVEVGYFVMVQTMVIVPPDSSVNRIIIFVSVDLYPHVIHHAPAIVHFVRSSAPRPSV